MKFSLPKLGILIGLVSLTFFFAALILAFGLRISTEAGWRSFHVPRVLWAGTGVLVLSSIAFEAARYALRRALLVVYRGRLRITVLLGAVFLAMQSIAAADLMNQGVAVAANPRGSAFYIFMAIHGAHLAVGIGWLAVLWTGSRKLFHATEQELRIYRRNLDAAAWFWHFMGVLWIVLLLFLRRWMGQA